VEQEAMKYRFAEMIRELKKQEILPRRDEH
jgi:hypothetical protein